MEEWAKQWMQEQREKGETCIEVKVINGNTYVYRSTSKYDKETKGPKKVTTYLGRLTQKHGFIPKGEKAAVIQPRSVHEYGNAALLAEEASELIPLLQEAFPGSWQEIIALMFTRITGYTPLYQVKDRWEKLDNILEIAPNCDPQILSQTLTAVGGDYSAQEDIFQFLSSQSNRLVYDLSFIFSHSDTVNLAEFGYNAEGAYLPQVNIALFSSLDTNMPVMIRALPGSVKDVSTLAGSLEGIDTNNITLILDRGFVSEENETLLQQLDINFILPMRRNSKRYEKRVHLKEHFFYHDRLIHAGSRETGALTLYLYKDVDLAADEEKTIYRQFSEGKIDRTTLNERMKRAGKILIISSLIASPQEIYELYKSRNMVESHFKTFKDLIQADKLYLRDATSVFGHVFVGFLCLYLYCRIQNRIRQAGLLSHLSPQGLLLKLSKVYSVNSGTDKRITEVPKQVRTIADKLQFDIIPMKTGV